jgi:CMP-N-acetylneuraminic acid synthetase
MSAPVFNREVWALVPARGGSKSIPRKNLVELNGIPLLDYVVRAAQAVPEIGRILGSTDDAEIAERMRHLGVETHPRPAELGGDDTPVAAVAAHLLGELAAVGRVLPEIIVLLQATSPFLLPDHIARLVAAMRADPTAGSGQTVIACPHNSHQLNQRWLEDGRVGFIFEKERQASYNKQRKQKHYLFGNLVATRSRRLLDGDSFFATPSIGIEIPRLFGFDLDDAQDLDLAEAILRGGGVDLPHMRAHAGE